MSAAAERYRRNHALGALTDALLSAWPAAWERHARELEAARPVPGEYTGQATREELSAAWCRLTGAAAACRARGSLASVELFELFEADVDEALDEEVA